MTIITRRMMLDIETTWHLPRMIGGTPAQRETARRERAIATATLIASRRIHTQREARVMLDYIARTISNNTADWTSANKIRRI